MSERAKTASEAMSHDEPEQPEPLPEPPLPLALPPLPGAPPDPVDPPEPFIDDPPLAGDPPLADVRGLPAQPAPVMVQPAATTPIKLRAIHARAANGVRLPAFSARLAIITIPLGVLQKARGGPGTIRFQPRLPAAVRAAVGALAFGAVTKVVLRLNRSPWPKERMRDLGVLHVPRGAFPTLWTLTSGPRPVIVAWAAGTRRRPAAQA